jgi:hypothetical protein
MIGKENKSSSTEIHPVGFLMASLTRPLEAMRARFPYKLIDPYTIEKTHNRNGRIGRPAEQHGVLNSTHPHARRRETLPASLPRPTALLQ